jgi:hypothetical protein
VALSNDRHSMPSQTPSDTAVAPSNEEEQRQSSDQVASSSLPSHILEDGRFIYLPPPSKPERSRFLERSIVRHGLLEADMMGKAKEDKEAKEEKDTAPKVHPLAVASARLQSSGLQELNRAINLSSLVQTGEYLGLTTIVDPSLEAEAANQSTSTAAIKTLAQRDEEKVKATFVLKRKRAQFEKASTVLERHRKRLEAAIDAQAVVDKRLFELRKQWRLVAPEHGTRARLHAARPTEVVAVDVDVYDRDRVGGGNKALIGEQPSLAGRLASRVPRFATIELKDTYQSLLKNKRQEEKEKSEVSEEMEVDGEEKKDEIKNTQEPFLYTRAEPFAVADPTLGRVMENFDPSKIPMLTLRLDIQKSSTGFLQSAFLTPMATIENAQGAATTYHADEQVLVSLQHSLFCAALFGSIRSELDAEKAPAQAGAAQKVQPVAWLSCDSEQNFLAPPSVLAGRNSGHGLSALSVVHCHEGELKVQLDSEYTLCIKLVEADIEKGDSLEETPKNTATDASDSGSQSPEQLHALCRALLLHAQEVYHQHSLYLRAHAKKKREEEAALGDGPRGLAAIKKDDVLEKPRILQSCVSLGSKMLFEKRVRKALNVSRL